MAYSVAYSVALFSGTEQIMLVDFAFWFTILMQEGHPEHFLRDFLLLAVRLNIEIL